VLAVTRKPDGGETEPSMPSPPDVEAFRRVAEAYCASVEQPDDENYDAFVLRLGGLLADLVSAGYRLPLVEPVADVTTSTSISQERWHEHYIALQSRFREHDLYWSTSYEAVALHEPPVTPRSLADDLADIWRDLRGGLDALEGGATWQDVSWEWRFGLEKHWGKHAVEALRALHSATT
jgi:hypothetical protein